MAKYKESKMRYGRYMKEDCCEDCDYVGGSMQIAGCYYPDYQLNRYSACPECGGKLEAVLGRWKYTEKLVGGFFGWFCDTKTTYHGFERGRQVNEIKGREAIRSLGLDYPIGSAGHPVNNLIDAEAVQESFAHRNEEVAKWLDECSPYRYEWHNIEKEGYPPAAGVEYDVYTHDAGYTKVVKVITYDGGNYSPIWLNDNGAEWIFPVTHWRLRPAPPK